MENWLERWARFVGRWPLIVIALWIILIIAALKFGPSLNDVATKQSVNTGLPGKALSTRADNLYQEKFAVGQQSTNKESDLLILTNPNGINQQDIALAVQIEAWLQSPQTKLSHFSSVVGPTQTIPATAFESNDKQALRLIVTWDTTGGIPDSSMKAVEGYLAQQHLAPGQTLGFTGSRPINYDLETGVLSGLNSSNRVSSLIGLLIILVVLGIVYRSPLAVLVPLLAVAAAAGVTLPLLAWLGATFNFPVASFDSEYVAFVLLGAGTNYGIFMLSRYREEIQRSNSYDRQARREALARAVGSVGESIISSASTVIVATAIMGLAQIYVLRVTGPAIAVGVFVLLLAGLSLLPALMALCGKALFWPAQPRPGTITDQSALEKGIWARAAQMVTGHSRLVAILSALVLVPLAVSAFMVQPSFDELQSLPASAQSVNAFNAYKAHFHDTAQVQVLFNAPGLNLRQAQYQNDIQQIKQRLSTVAHVTAVQAPTDGNSAQFANDGSALAYTVGLNVDATSQDASQVVNNLYSSAASAQQSTALSHAEVLISGESSLVRDEIAQYNSDFLLIVILVCIAIYLILALLVRSVTAPIYLLATIALSALTAVGITNLVYNVWLGKPLFSIVPVFAFVFLVSLGEDFNILTMARIREEIIKLGHKRGIATAVALTGGVISSCGLVMAASFSRLASNAIVEIAELGLTVVVGVILDTFIVRPLLVPAIVNLLGRWNWIWPGSKLYKQYVTSSVPTLEEIKENNIQEIRQADSLTQ